MKDDLKKSATSSYLRRAMPDSPEFHPAKAAKIYNRFEAPIKKSYEEMEEAKPQYRRLQKAHGGKINLKDCVVNTAEHKNSKHKKF